MTIISLSLPESMLDQIDQTMKEKGFVSRSEIARQALRLYLTEDLKIEEIDGEAVATITLIYQENADRRRLMEAQHVYSGLVATFLHTLSIRLSARSNYNKGKLVNKKIFRQPKTKRTNNTNKNICLKQIIHYAHNFQLVFNQDN